MKATSWFVGQLFFFFTLTLGNSESSNLYLWRAEINKFCFPKWKRRNVHIYKDYIKKWNALFDIYLKMCFLIVSEKIWRFDKNKEEAIYH